MKNTVLLTIFILGIIVFGLGIYLTFFAGTLSGIFLLIMGGIDIEYVASKVVK